MERLILKNRKEQNTNGETESIPLDTVSETLDVIPDDDRYRVERPALETEPAPEVLEKLSMKEEDEIKELQALLDDGQVVKTVETIGPESGSIPQVSDSTRPPAQPPEQEPGFMGWMKHKLKLGKAWWKYKASATYRNRNNKIPWTEIHHDGAVTYHDGTGFTRDQLERNRQQEVAVLQQEREQVASESP